MSNDAVISVHIEGGKRNNSGVQLYITGDEGDLKVTNVSAFGGPGEDYIIEGAHGDNVPLVVLPVPASYQWIDDPGLPSGVAELAHLYAAYAADLRNGTHAAPTFDDGLWLHQFFDLMHKSSLKGIRVNV